MAPTSPSPWSFHSVCFSDFFTFHQGISSLQIYSLRPRNGSSSLGPQPCSWHIVAVDWLSHVQLCDPMDCSPPGSSVHGISQARTLEWLPCPPPGDLPDPGIKPSAPALQADSLLLSQQGSSSWHIVSTHLFHKLSL